uniref:Uncharacterized protein n=1 Tax=Anguilla anguilla TaxID=7936 RepID=A0A0E9WG84_ANGAN
MPRTSPCCGDSFFPATPIAFSFCFLCAVTFCFLSARFCFTGDSLLIIKSALHFYWPLAVAAPPCVAPVPSACFHVGSISFRVLLRQSYLRDVSLA